MSMVVGLVKDLLDRSRILGMARAVGSSVEFVSSLEELRGLEIRPGTTVFVDLTDSELEGLKVPETIEERKRSGDVRVVGFISHTDREGIAAAEAAGFDEVLSRAAFFKRLSVLLAETRGASSEPRRGEDPHPTR